MKELWRIYHEEMPDFLSAFANTAPLLRLKEVGMNCGCEYTGFPLFRGLRPYSRYDHSVGAALIVWHFTGSIRQSLAALFHDITTPAFAHAVDFLNGDHLRQESTEAGTAECIAAADDICRLLGEYGIAPEEVSDYHLYPIADNDPPALSADRLEYTMGNLLNYGFADIEEIAAVYADITVGADEKGRPELTFRSADMAVRFAEAALKNSRVYVADEDRFAMEALARLLKKAVHRGVLTPGDLMTTEPQVIAKLLSDGECAAGWKRFCGYSKLLVSDIEPAEGFWVAVNAKKRWIDPLAEGLGRASARSPEVAAEIAKLCGRSFAYWLSAE